VVPFVLGRKRNELSKQQLTRFCQSFLAAKLRCPRISEMGLGKIPQRFHGLQPFGTTVARACRHIGGNVPMQHLGIHFLGVGTDPGRRGIRASPCLIEAVSDPDEGFSGEILAEGTANEEASKWDGKAPCPVPETAQIVDFGKPCFEEGESGFVDDHSGVDLFARDGTRKQVETEKKLARNFEAFGGEPGAPQDMGARSVSRKADLGIRDEQVFAFPGSDHERSDRIGKGAAGGEDAVVVQKTRCCRA